MKVKWKCIWNVVKLYFLGLCAAIAILLGVIWLVTNWMNLVVIPSVNESEISVTNYAVTAYPIQGCGCGFGTTLLPLGLIFIGGIILIYTLYQDIKPCIIWEDK